MSASRNGLPIAIGAAGWLTTIFASALLAIGGRLAEAAWLVWVFKPLTTVLIIALALRVTNSRFGRHGAGAGSPTPERTGGQRYRLGVLAGLVASLAGDVFLIPEGLFVWGLVAFLVAHLCYLYAFTDGVRLFARAWPPMVIAAVALLILQRLWPGVPTELRGPVIAYVALLASMTAQALARAGVRRDRSARFAAVGGVLFLGSDALLALDRFHAPLPWAGLWVLATYWSAQTLIALSLSPRAREAR